MSPGGAPVADPLGHKGGKHPLWISGTDRRILDDMSKAAGAPVTPGMVFRHGLATMQDPVLSGPDLAPALDLVARLAAALARGGRVTYGDSPGPAAGQDDAETLEAAAGLLRKYFHPSRRGGQVPSEGLAGQLTVAETLLEFAARQARGSEDELPVALALVHDSDSVISSGSAGVVTPEQYGGQEEP